MERNTEEVVIDEKSPELVGFLSTATAREYIYRGYVYRAVTASWINMFELA